MLIMIHHDCMCDSKIAVILLSPRAVTRLNVCNQMIMY